MILGTEYPTRKGNIPLASLCFPLPEIRILVVLRKPALLSQNQSFCIVCASCASISVEWKSEMNQATSHEPSNHDDIHSACPSSDEQNNENKDAVNPRVHPCIDHSVMIQAELSKGLTAVSISEKREEQDRADQHQHHKNEHEHEHELKNENENDQIETNEVQANQHAQTESGIESVDARMQTGLKSNPSRKVRGRGSVKYNPQSHNQPQHHLQPRPWPDEIRKHQPDPSRNSTAVKTKPNSTHENNASSSLIAATIVRDSSNTLAVPLSTRSKQEWMDSTIEITFVSAKRHEEMRNDVQSRGCPGLQEIDNAREDSLVVYFDANDNAQACMDLYAKLNDVECRWISRASPAAQRAFRKKLVKAGHASATTTVASRLINSALANPQFPQKGKSNNTSM